ncbi:MAG: hypothetical protein JWN33_16 [Candidatus Saccharibacteria bacterium]|nr:hypothetical protein [Candidatus Saccharibacteria bacterium]
MFKHWYLRAEKWLRRHYRHAFIYGGIGLLVGIIAFQFIYPSQKLLPFESVESVALSGWNKHDAITRLDTEYKKTKVGIYFGDVSEAYRTPKLAELGITADNSERINSLNYPWYLRLVPGSLFWAHVLVTPSKHPTYHRSETGLVTYIAKELGSSCQVAPKDASLKEKDGALVVVPSAPGGTCDPDDVKSALESVQPTRNDAQVKIKVEVVAPAVSNDDAQKLADSLTDRIGDEVTITVNDNPQVLPASEVISWLDFKTVDGELAYEFNAERAAPYLEKAFAPKVTVNPGVTTVTTVDFVETARSTGPSGQALDVPSTLALIRDYIEGQVDTAAVATKIVPPTVSYNRSYSATDTGLAALMKNYAEAHGGTFGVSLVELSDKRRHADYQGDKQFTTASTYKLLVAYSTLKRVEDGTWKWTDYVAGGRDLTVCFDDMIVKSDNACAEALLKKIGFSAITKEAQALGMTKTTFLGSDGIKSTPNDLTLLLSMLQSGQVLTQQSNRDRWISAMSRNIYRQGIPAGATGSVANKVGFLDDWLNDAAIVSSPSGVYVLTIMTQDSSWATIADFTREIEKVRSQ